MKLPILLLVAAGLLPVAASAQHSMIDDDGSIRVASSLVSGASVQGPGSLCTDFNTNNGYAGNMFDIEPTVSAQMTAIDVNVDGVGQQVDVDVWYIPDTSFGNENSATGWTLIGSYSGISAGADLPSFIDITSYSSGTSMNDTNGDTQGTASGNDEWSNAELKIVGYSLAGMGPTTTPFGVVDLSPPIFQLPPDSVDSNGVTSKSYLIPHALLAARFTCRPSTLWGQVLAKSPIS
jgi:hypothetical protein